ncbi:MAG TPA: NAD-dependent epimerase/dehydratase family protein [Planctomycetota bacterium]|nr:NAD-dependent epimerase/dehydratase family protein [Planctomycetota bacterium]
MKVLVTGGAGFIGSHTVDRLVALGHDVVSLDVLEPRVHGGHSPRWLNEGCRYLQGDVCDPVAVEKALEDRTHVLHLAAAVGLGQSMVEIARFTEVNAVGTAVLLEAIAARKDKIERLAVASSMSVYGEGLYFCASCGPVDRGVLHVPTNKSFEPPCPYCESPLEPLPTPEEKILEPSSIYALGKQFQEISCLTVGASYGIPTLALRYFNVYGPRQALSNPYTGVAAIFCARILNGKRPFIYEDGEQRRDFVHVSDVAEANVLALGAPPEITGAVNVASGESRSVLDVARALIERLRPSLEPVVSHERRKGDTRHCFADTELARARLGFTARARFEDKIDELVRAVQGESAEDRFDAHRAELAARGLAA